MSVEKSKVLKQNFMIFFLSFVLIMSGALTTAQCSVYADSSDFESQLKAENFPESYKVRLRALHQLHPQWKFKANHLGYSWEDALAKQYANQNANLVSVNFPDSYKAVKSGTYDFVNKTYIGKDGSDWVSASKQAVSFYMDPRNFIQEDGIFMFESLSYDSSYQKESIVRKILEDTALPKEASAYYMSAGSQDYNGIKYEISPIYLAVQTRLELGRGDFMINGHQFTYGGKEYKNCYNTYNIGAYDSADGSAATKGLVFAGGGADGSETSYLRPWNTLEKAVKGGAIYIAEAFIGNNQDTMYYERYNVANGLSSVGTHQYATNIFHAYTMASIMQSNYKDFGVIDEPFTFEIPVFENMPETPCEQPRSTGNNNCYLDGFTVKTNLGDKLEYTPKFNRFTNTYTITENVSSEVKSLSISHVKNSGDSVVKITGNKELAYGENKITIRCKSSSGYVSKYYYLKINRERPKIYLPNNPKNLTAENKGGSKIALNWKGDSNATGYIISYKKHDFDKWYDIKTAKTSYSKNMATEGVLYDFRVRAYYEEDGEINYSKGYSDTVSQATFGEVGTLNGSLNKGYMTVELTWPETSGADGYTVNYRMRPDGEWMTADTDTSQFTQKMERAGKGYDFYVVPYMEAGGVKYYDGANSDTKTIYTLKKVSVALNPEFTRCIRISWNNISGETGYEIYRSKTPDKKFKRIIKPSNKRDSYLDQKLTVGTTYYYKVRAYRNIAPGVYVYGPYSEVVSVTR